MPQQERLICILSHAAKSSELDRSIVFFKVLCRSSSRSALNKQAAIPTASSTMKTTPSRIANYVKYVEGIAVYHVFHILSKETILTAMRRVGDSLIAP